MNNIKRVVDITDDFDFGIALPAACVDDDHAKPLVLPDAPAVEFAGHILHMVESCNEWI